MTEDAWTANHDRAVLLVAEDALTDNEIASDLKISKRTLETWKAQPLFREKLDAAIGEIRQALMQHGIARLDRRVARLDKTWRDLQSVIEQRATEMKGDFAGTDTGLMIMQEKGMGGGDNFVRVDEYSLDTGLLAELRALEMQAAKELGQWTEKRDVTSRGEALGGASAFTDEELDDTLTRLQKRKTAAAVPLLP